MCSVVGYIGKAYSRQFVLEALTRLEYRGYDSSGFACLHPSSNHLLHCKAEGGLQNLTDKFKQMPIDGHVGIGHTRWSTHGKPTELNAHPHFDCTGLISVVHNGIIENYQSLKEYLLSRSHHFTSDTDTEIIAHLLELLIAQESTMHEAIVQLVNMLQGAYAFLCITEHIPHQLLVVRKRSPVCIGVGNDEMFIASDMLAFADKTAQVLFMPDESFALVRQDQVELYDFSGRALPVTFHDIAIDVYAGTKNGHEHFMLKEIYEQKDAIHATAAHISALGDLLWQQMGISLQQVHSLERLTLVACGTSWHAARIAQFFFELVCHIPVKVCLASEMRYMPFFNEKDSVCIAVSQSGETADTLEVVRMVRAYGMPIVALTNVASSTIVREADGYLLTQAGHEIAVASTKAFSTQLTALYVLAHAIAYHKGLITYEQYQSCQDDLYVTAQVLENTIHAYKFDIKQHLAAHYAQYKQSIFLGRSISYPFALEAALKLKEISYIFAQCYPAGELKHGPLALIDTNTPVFIFSCQDPLIYQKLVANAQEVKSRGGRIVAFCFEEQYELITVAETSFIFPPVKPLLEPLAMSGVMQYFVYEIARFLGCSIDKPRNLAKSVTVE